VERGDPSEMSRTWGKKRTETRGHGKRRSAKNKGLWRKKEKDLGGVGMMVREEGGLQIQSMGEF